MDRVTVDRVGIHLLMVVKDAVSPEGPRANNMPVCQDVAPLGVHDKASGLGVQGWIGVEGAGLAEADGDDIPDDILDGELPLGGVWPQGGEGLQGGFLDELVVVHVEVGGFDVGGVVAGRLLAVQGVTMVFRGPASLEGVEWGGLALGARRGVCAVHVESA